MLMILDMELCEEAGRPYGNERRAIRVRPQKGRQLVKHVLGKVVGNDDGESGKPSLSLVCSEEVFDVLEHSFPLYAFVELAKERHGLLSARLAYRLHCVEEEVVASISGRSDGSIQDGKVTDAREDEVLEDGGRCS